MAVDASLPVRLSRYMCLDTGSTSFFPGSFIVSRYLRNTSILSKYNGIYYLIYQIYRARRNQLTTRRTTTEKDAAFTL